MEKSKVKIKFYQEADSGRPYGEDDEGNILTVETENNGIGNYIVISTKRWAIDPDELIEFANELKKVWDIGEK